MTVCDLKRGEAALVLSVGEEGALRERLRVLGIYAGARVELLRTSRRKTFLLLTACGKAALGRSVAEGVRVCKV